MVMVSKTLQNSALLCHDRLLSSSRGGSIELINSMIWKILNKETFTLLLMPPDSCVVDPQGLTGPTELFP